jgi:maltooligosyltrehalose trehalohydrolase
LRFKHDAGERLLVINLGADLEPRIVPEPLLAPPAGAQWTLLWSSEDPEYGGRGVVPPASDGHWHVVGHAAVVLMPAAI